MREITAFSVLGLGTMICVSAWGFELKLPPQSNIKAYSIFSSKSQSLPPGAENQSLRFAVDEKERTWLGIGRDLLACPMNGQAYRLSRPYRDLVFQDNGTFWLSTDSDFGFIIKEGKMAPDGFVVATYQPVAFLPAENNRMAPAGGDQLYFYGPAADHKLFNVYCWKRGSALKRIFSTPSKITAVAGDGDKTFVAIGQTIVEIDRGKKGAREILTHPSESVTSLAYDPKIGLYFATPAAVGYAGDNGIFIFLAFSDPQLFIRKGSLYALGKASGDVIKLDGLEELAHLAGSGERPL